MYNFLYIIGNSPYFNASEVVEVLEFDRMI